MPSRFAALFVLLALSAAPVFARDEIDYEDIRKATDATARQFGPAAPDFKKAEPPKTERKPLNQSFGWEAGMPVAPGHTAETEAERERARDSAEQRFLTPRTLRTATPAAPVAPSPPALPTVTLEGPGDQGKKSAAAEESSPAASRIARDIAEQLRARNAQTGGSAKIVLDEISASGRSLPGTAIDTRSAPAAD